MKHWIIYRFTEDPPGVEIIGVYHSQEGADQGLISAAQTESDAVNARREELFLAGEGCNQRVNADRFKYRYKIRDVE